MAWFAYLAHVPLLAIWTSLKSILPAVVCLASCRIGLYHKIAPEAGPGIAQVSYGKDYSYSYLTRETLPDTPSWINHGQHFLASNCNTCICCCANCYSYTAVQLLYILMCAQSSSIATASSLWCELSDQVQCVYLKCSCSYTLHNDTNEQMFETLGCILVLLTTQRCMKQLVLHTDLLAAASYC